MKRDSKEQSSSNLDAGEAANRKKPTMITLAQAVTPDVNSGLALGGGMVILGLILVSIVIAIVWTVFPFIVWAKFNRVIALLQKSESTLKPLMIMALLAIAATAHADVTL